MANVYCSRASWNWLALNRVLPLSLISVDLLIFSLYVILSWATEYIFIYLEYPSERGTIGKSSRGCSYNHAHQGIQLSRT
jgi:hypothetical protein